MADARLVLRYAARSDVGRLRSKNDDSAYAGRHLAVVADGMGGHAGGDVASASTVLDLIHLDHGDYAPGEAATQLADEIQTANSLLSELVSANPLLAGMGTTVTAILLSGDSFAFAHIGDSRAYRLRGNDLEQVSVDHTFVQRLINEGRLRPEEAETHPHKNVLMRVLGDVDASPELDLSTFPAVEGERWLLCSDGLNYVPLPLVERTLREYDDRAECADRLIELTLAAGAPDNVTVIVADVEATEDDDALPAPAAPPAAAPLTAAAAARTPVTSAAAPSAAAPAGAAGKAQASGTAPKAGAAGKGAAPAAPTASPASKDSEKQPAKASDGARPAGAASPAAEAPSEEGPGTPAAVGDEDRREEPATDPNLGAHLSAEVLRRELESRPHELVGAAASAAETGSLPSVASRTAARRAAAILMHRSPEAEAEAEAEDEESTSSDRPARRWFRLGLGILAALAVVVGLWFGYAWTQTRYYVGAFDNRVAIYNGVSQQLGPIPLSHVHTVTNIPLDSLSPFTQQRLRSGVPADGLEGAEEIVRNIQTDPQGCLPGSGATASPTATPSGSAPPSSSAAAAAPSAAPSASATPSASASGSPSTSPTPDPCLGGTR
ncbi:PP2C family serine/threonine-protein phosphatase [Sinomonas sp. R1AF57]|uniref:PP2C family protein-serine/threonine phosphatase n=1 Tax=Sinomonas sp. R1AF57 TaxID=2020377 RepID=UPI0021018FED|nr:protein phosphatase 2C domain-containing protein [Sinomonas sp. R1AF57]